LLNPLCGWRNLGLADVKFLPLLRQMISQRPIGSKTLARAASCAVNDKVNTTIILAYAL
jgi:hypothetical protein